MLSYICCFSNTAAYVTHDDSTQEKHEKINQPQDKQELVQENSHMRKRVEALHSELQKEKEYHQEALQRIESLRHQKTQLSGELEQVRISNKQDLEKVGTENSLLQDQVEAMRTNLENYKGCHHGALRKITSLEQTDAKVRNRLDEVLHSLNKEQMERASLSADVNRFYILLAAEQKCRKETEMERDRCQRLLEEQMAKQMLGRGMNIQGNILTLPEVFETVRRTLTITVNTWMENALEILAPSGIGDDHLVQFVLVQLLQLSLDIVGSHRQDVTSIFLGKVEGSTEQDMDPESSQFMRQHLRRHYQTLFPLEQAARAKATREVVSKIATEISRKAEGDDSVLQVDQILRLLTASGLENIVDKYLHILVSCTLQNPPVTFTTDCGTVEKFDSERHHLPIDGDMAESQCIIVFPGLIVDGEHTQDPHPESKRYVLVVQDDPQHRRLLAGGQE